MTKNIKEHEKIYLHIKRYGILRGLLLLPFNLVFAIISFPCMFLVSYLAWYDGRIPNKYPNYIAFFYGLKAQKSTTKPKASGHNYRKTKGSRSITKR